jgi:hypothetical protein
MARYQIVWGLGFKKISPKHQICLNKAYENLVNYLGDSVLSSNFQVFHDSLKELNTSSTFDFIAELSTTNKDYSHINYLRKKYLKESFALLNDFDGFLNAQRTLFEKGSINVTEGYGLYRRLIPEIITNGQEIYYCAFKSWLIGTKRKKLKEMVLAKFSDVVAERAKKEKRGYFEHFASRYERAIKYAFQESGYGTLHFQCLIGGEKSFLDKLSKPIALNYESYVRKNDMLWLTNHFPNSKEATNILKADVKNLQITLRCGRLFLNFLPCYGLFHSLWQRPIFRRKAKGSLTNFYPDCCKNVTYLPFGKVGYWPPAGGVYMVGLMHSATRWLEEFSKPYQTLRGL